MIVAFFINIIVLVLAAIFSLFPVVSTLPTVGGFDIDTALVSGMGEMNTFMASFWPLKDLMLGFLALMLYYSVKIVLRFFLGHRAPAGS